MFIMFIHETREGCQWREMEGNGGKWRQIEWEAEQGMVVSEFERVSALYRPA